MKHSVVRRLHSTIQKISRDHKAGPPSIWQRTIARAKLATKRTALAIFAGLLNGP